MAFENYFVYPVYDLVSLILVAHATFFFFNLLLRKLSYEYFFWGLKFQVFAEKAYLVGVECKSSEDKLFSIEESLKELGQLADTAGLFVVGSTYQK